LGAYRLGADRLDAPFLHVGSHSLHWGLNLRAYSLGVYRLGAYRIDPPILNLGSHSLHWGIQSGIDYLFVFVTDASASEHGT
jgi:hypothetical protein